MFCVKELLNLIENLRIKLTSYLWNSQNIKKEIAKVFKSWKPYFLKNKL